MKSRLFPCIYRINVPFSVGAPGFPARNGCVAAKEGGVTLLAQTPGSVRKYVLSAAWKTLISHQGANQTSHGADGVGNSPAISSTARRFSTDRPRLTKTLLNLWFMRSTSAATTSTRSVASQTCSHVLSLCTRYSRATLGH